MKVVFNLPPHLHADRVAGGRVGATRWQLLDRNAPADAEYDGWVGDIVRFMPEAVWVWQPKDGDRIESTTLAGLLPYLP